MQVEDHILLGRPRAAGSVEMMPAVIKRVGDQSISIELGSDLHQLQGLEDGQRVLVFERQARRFMQRSARIESVTESEDGHRRVILVLLSDAVTAESRDSYRVTTMARDLEIVVNSNDRCAVLDLSSTGFSLKSSEDYCVGDILEIELTVAGKVYTGTATLRNARLFGAHTHRYGLHCVEDEGGEELSQSLGSLTSLLQREQVSLLAGSA